MGFYADHVFPRLMELCLGTRKFQEQREQALTSVQGNVLEIGFGTGLNLPHYPKTVTCLTAVDPAIFLRNTVAQRTAELPFPVALLYMSAETLPFEEGRFDCAVSTLTLCTISDAVAALREVRRVLKPEGTFVFLEHGRSDDKKVAKWQDRLNPIQRIIACGCNLNRPIDALIRQAGLRLDRLDRFQMPGIPRIAGEMYRGVATPLTFAR
ncbi:MAG: class I SAM-dependent methyltransferase [Nitrospirae bacterium]|nr:MAG: class I SAM-dependent methyltransferase [Nitrospirota bacterium]